MRSMNEDPYEVLGVLPSASLVEIKSAYRKLVKKHHPDAGGDTRVILALNAAWELLKNTDKRNTYDNKQKQKESLETESKLRDKRNASASAAANVIQNQVAKEENALFVWQKEVYIPIDKLLGQIIKPFTSEVRNLSADPYDDQLMENFCNYREQSKKRIEKVEKIYQSMATPCSAQGFGLNLYHCLSQIKDAIIELERYTMGYVDNYLHDGREMIQEAKQIRSRLKMEYRKFNYK